MNDQHCGAEFEIDHETSYTVHWMLSCQHTLTATLGQCDVLRRVAPLVDDLGELPPQVAPPGVLQSAAVYFLREFYLQCPQPGRKTTPYRLFLLH